MDEGEGHTAMNSVDNQKYWTIAKTNKREKIKKRQKFLEEIILKLIWKQISCFYARLVTILSELHNPETLVILIQLLIIKFILLQLLNINNDIYSSIIS